MSKKSLLTKEVNKQNFEPLLDLNESPTKFWSNSFSDLLEIDIFIEVSGLLSKNSPKINKIKFFAITSGSALVYKDSAKDENYKGFAMIFCLNMETSKLDEHFVIRLSRKNSTVELYTRSLSTFENFTRELEKRMAHQHWQNKYEFISLLGAGAFGTVNKVFNKQDRQLYAMKHFKKAKIKTVTQKISLINEIRILFYLDHPSILKLYELFEDEDEFIIVLEFISGPQIFEKLVKERRIYNEREALQIVGLIANVLEFLKLYKIVHRDLKLENVMFSDPVAEDEIKVIDFGFAIIKGAKYSKNKCGTPGYVAPEILQGLKYDEKADIFSLGIILYVLIGRVFPFTGKEFKEVLKKNMECNVSFSGNRWKGVSQQIIELIKKMTCRDPKFRISIEELMQEPIFLKYVGETNNKHKEILHSKATILRKKTDMINQKKEESKVDDKNSFKKRQTKNTAEISSEESVDIKQLRPQLKTVSQIENLSQFVLLQNLKRRYKEAEEISQQQEKDSFIVASGYEKKILFKQTFERIINRI